MLFLSQRENGGQRGILLFTESAVSVQDHTVWDPGTPESLDVRGLHDASCSHHGPPPRRDDLGPIICSQLTHRSNNYEYLVP